MYTPHTITINFRALLERCRPSQALIVDCGRGLKYQCVAPVHIGIIGFIFIELRTHTDSGIHGVRKL